MELVSTNLGLAKEAYQKFLDGDIPGLMEFYNEDSVYQYHGPAVSPFAGNYEGKAGILRFFQQLGETIDLLLFEPQEYIDGGDKIVVIGRESVRSKKTGKTFEGPFVHVAEVEDGKIKRLRFYPDTAGAITIFSE